MNYNIVLFVKFESIVRFTLALLLIFSIIGPSIQKLYSSNLEEIVFIDNPKEENHNKVESELDDNKIFEENLPQVSVLINRNFKSIIDYYLIITSNDFLEINNPPPEYII